MTTPGARAYFVLGLGVIILAGIAFYGGMRFHAAAAPSTTATTTPSVVAKKTTTPAPVPFMLASPAFTAGATIPYTYTCDGSGSDSPPLTISGIPTGTKSMALIMKDPDVSTALIPEGVFIHWVVYNIPPDTTSLPEGTTVGTPGGNGQDELAYTGPCPDPSYAPAMHHYIFTLYALSDTLSFSHAPTAADLVSAMHGDIIAQTQLIGTYARK